MIRSAESPTACLTREWLDAGVFTEMPPEFIGTREAPFAALPSTHEGFFT